jgi:hypothetical protein
MPIRRNEKSSKSENAKKARNSEGKLGNLKIMRNSDVIRKRPKGEKRQREPLFLSEMAKFFG